MILKLLLLLVSLLGSSASMESNTLVVTEQAYLNWIKHVGSIKHALFPKAENRFKPCLTIQVNKKPKSGEFLTLQKAISSLPIDNDCRVVIHIGAGFYREKVEIPATMAYITMEGADAEKTIIEWDDTADRSGKTGSPLGTYGSATFGVNSPYFIAKNITFKNRAPAPPSGALGKQAVALRISADTAAFISCRFIGAQDTLYDHVGRHYFKDCYIKGSVDFIFGNGLSLYKDCHLHAIADSYGALTAQKRGSLLEETGFSFVNCKVTGSGALYLGRAWGTFSRVVFAYTYMDKIITPRGWYDWGDKNREMTVFYGQYKCMGPGADKTGRVPWSRELTEEEAEPFISNSFIDGDQWLPESS
ncbi:Pectin lyase-like superfamily protein isoform 1 [Tripterygium wilfordii]|uniref:Pectinesterase n=1 Tax=Tripterygium wilfordii TaxID=458696 RepID=A0A7J7E421_TRIWF|nr:probable pectinesterase 53 [Tripterygium wilfordii]KAF5753026.1 Pectin lyase-like superfamily protein isoform 1 [Tripterygium wilfordii]